MSARRAGAGRGGSGNGRCRSLEKQEKGSHSHTHDPKEIRAVINRLSRSIGHLQSVKRMVENGVDCSDVLVQIAAVRAELNNAGKVLLKQHLEHCIVDAVEENDTEAVAKMNAAIDRFMK